MEETSSEVKGQPKPTGFQIHPENINRLGGPPKTHWWTQLYMDELEKDSERRKGLKKKESVVQATVEKAEEGDLPSIKEIGDRVQGKAPQSVGTFGDLGEFQPQNLVVLYGHDGGENSSEA